MKILFLDIDGVMNCEADFDSSNTRLDVLNSTLVSRIIEVITKTDCRVVISSSWRLTMPLGLLKALLRIYKFPTDYIIDITPSLDRRDNEIQTWLDQYPGQISRYVIVDDVEENLTALAHKLVKTSFTSGVTGDDVIELIRRLNET